MPGTPRAAIIGGGLGGLASCLALHQRGIEAVVYEQTAELSEIGAGLNMSPNALKALRALGIEDEAIAIGFQPDDQVIRSWRSGRVIARQQRGGNIADRFGAIFLSMHRADLLAIFARALPESCVRLGARCTSVDAASEGAVARFADGTEIEADIIIGADGIHSAVRESLFGHIDPTFTGCICWRGLVPADAVAHIDSVRDMTAWWGPHGHIVHYPVRRGELVNFVAHLNSDGWTEESWTYECDREELMETYASWNKSLRQLIESSERYYKWALYDREPLERWGEGPITLLGDSAHPMLPYLGQGACMAIEDGCILAEAVARSPDRLTEALRDYERLRMPRTKRAQLGSRQRAKENHLASPFARLKRDLRMAYRSRFGKDKSPIQAEWLYDYDVSAENGYSATPISATAQSNQGKTR
jgi:salicylate hydroxylase